jgi:uncharacterized BrkB/YihY/UPF0761 family membrane protein
MGALKRLVAVADRWQRRNRIAGPAYGVVKKFGDDQANLLVVALGWYGFTAIYPLLLVVVTIFGFIGVASLGTGIVRTLHQFPVIGTQFNPGDAGSNLHGSVIGLVIGVAGLVYGAQGVTQTAHQAMITVWDTPEAARPAFLPRLARSIGALLLIGGAFIANAFVGSIAAGIGQTLIVRVVLLAALVIANAGFYLATFRVLTPKDVPARSLVPGAVLGGVAFTLLITVGTGLVQHQLRHASATYGAFATVIGTVTFLFLLAKVSIYSAELNPVLAQRLYPRALPMAEPTDLDEAARRSEDGHRPSLAPCSSPPLTASASSEPSSSVSSRA